MENGSWKMHTAWPPPGVAFTWYRIRAAHGSSSNSESGLEFPVAVRSLRMSPVQTSFESPWQNGVPNAGSQTAGKIDDTRLIGMQLKAKLRDCLQSFTSDASVQEMSLNLPGKFCFGKDGQRFLINTQVKNVDIRPMS